MNLHNRCKISTEKQFRESLTYAFDNVDIDKSQCLNKMEFQDVMRRVTFIMGADDCTQEDIDFIMSRLDRNGDTTVSKQQFQRLVNILVKIAFSAPKTKHKKQIPA